MNFDIKLSPPDITDEEIEEVIKILKSGWITTGFKTKELEKKIAAFCNTEMAVCLNSATACLEMTLRILNIGPGDEVITSSYTYSSSCSVICHVGATPILIDTAKNSFEMDYEKLFNAVNEKTKAIIPVDLGGILVNYDKIFEIVNSKKDLFKSNGKFQEKIGRIAVIADSAHSFGAKKNNKIAGEIADFTAFSFHAVKNLTTAEGGAITWKNIDGIFNDEIYKNFMLFSLHGQSRDALEKSKIGNWEYDIVLPGYKCNMPDINAAIGLIQLKRFEKMQKKRLKIVNIYNEKLKNENLQLFQNILGEIQSSNHLYIVRVLGKNEIFRNDVIEKMAKNKIPTNVHYKPLPMFTAYKNLGFDIKNFKNAFKMYENEITLPLHSLLTYDEAEYIADTFKKVINTL